MHASSRRWYFWGGIFLVVALALLGMIKLATYDAAGGLTVANVSAEDWSKGTPGKPVLIEYSDFQCPFCAAYAPIVSQIVSEFSGRIQFVYREYPLFEIHKSALVAAYAAEAAGKQGKFWEMHDVLFQRQKEWSDAADPKPLFQQYAEQLGLNIDTFKSDSESNAVKDKVKRDRASGEAAKVPGTPTFFFNGKVLQVPRDVAAFRAALNYELRQISSPTTNAQ